MSLVGTAERLTQNRIIALFRDDLHYRYLGDWSDRKVIPTLMNPCSRTG